MAKRSKEFEMVLKAVVASIPAALLMAFLFWPKIIILTKKFRVAMYNRSVHYDEEGYRLTKFIDHRGEISTFRGKVLTPQELADNVWRQHRG